MIFLTLLIIPLLIAVISFIFLKGITWKEFLLLIGAVVLIVGISSAICYYNNLYYNEIWNGQVVSKDKEEVHCRHSYSCNCRIVTSGSGKNQTTTTHCDTCYEHRYDYDYVVRDNTGHSYDINTVDRQGLITPPRFETVEIEEPTAHVSSYKNYLKASSDSLFRKDFDNEKYKGKLPEYPNIIYDYYRLNRIVTTNFTLENKQHWDNILSDINGKLGKKKQANIILVLTKNQSQDYMQALDQYWKGGNKNDAIIVLNIDTNNKIEWVEVLALVKDDMFKIQLRDSLTNIETLNMEKIMPEIENCVSKYFVRKRMREFEYLTYAVTPSMTQYIVSLVLCLLVTIVLIVFFEEDNTFEGDPQ